MFVPLLEFGSCLWESFVGREKEVVEFMKSDDANLECFPAGGPALGKSGLRPDWAIVRKTAC